MESRPVACSLPETECENECIWPDCLSETERDELVQKIMKDMR